jgi:flagellar biosynthesis component FlhA
MKSGVKVKRREDEGYFRKAPAQERGSGANGERVLLLLYNLTRFHMRQLCSSVLLSIVVLRFAEVFCGL